MITGFHHISLKCESKEELDKVRHFYLDLLGFSLKREWPDGIMIDAGNCLLEVFSNGPGVKEKGAIRHMAFTTDDVDGIVSKVKAEGYEIFTEPKDIVIASEPPVNARMAFCYGPLGEEIEFFDEKD